MSEFVSVYNVVFGGRPVEEVKSEFGNLGIAYKLRPDMEPVDISKVVCAIEDETCKSYCFDEFGRFGQAKADDKERVKRNLAEFYKILSFGQLGDLDRYKDQASDPDDAPEWHFYGWLLDDLPDFEVCYDQWKAKNNRSGVEPIVVELELISPRVSNAIWSIAKGLLIHVIEQHLVVTTATGRKKREIKSADEIFGELQSSDSTIETMRLFDKCKELSPSYFNMDEKTFRNKINKMFRR
jgi:hypothetical protein